MKKNVWIILGLSMFLFVACTNQMPETEEVIEGAMSVVEEAAATENSDATTTLDEVEAEETIEEVTESVMEEEVTDEVEVVEEVETVVELTVEDYQTLAINEQGHIMVVMYHGILDNPPYHRVKEDFIKDLTFMYEHNYRLVSMSDYLNGTIGVEAGMTPIVLTFDDGLTSTFSLIDSEEGLTVDPESAIGLLESFAEAHPDFGREASLYIHANDWNFEGEGTPQERLNWLIDHGYEIGNHSNTHANFKTLDASGLLKEIGEVDKYIATVLPGYDMFAMTYPFGVRPSEGLLSTIYEGNYEGFDLDYRVAFREGPSGTFYPPVHIKFSPYNAPRVRGSEGEVQDMWWFFEHYEANAHQKYVSDGRSDTLVVPLGKESNISPSMVEKFELITYE